MRKHWSFKRVYCFGLIGAICLATRTQADISAFSIGPGSSSEPPSFDTTRGWAFVHRGSNPYIAITQLGVFDGGADGLMTAHKIGLWGPDGMLLASATVPAGTAAPLVDGYRYVSIAPVTMSLQSGAIVAAQYAAGDSDDVRPNVMTFAPDVDLPGVPFQSAGRYGIGSDLPFPSFVSVTPCGELCPGLAFLEASFQYTIVPEPSASVIVSLALFCFLVRCGRRRAKNSVNRF